MSPDPTPRRAYGSERLARMVGLVAVAALAGGLLVVGAVSAEAAPPLPAGRYVVATDDARAVAIAKRVGATPTLTWNGSLDGFAANLTGAQATALARAGDVVAIRPDVTISGFAQTVPVRVPTVEADGPPVDAGDGSGSVTGVAVAVIDTGVDNHVDYTVAGGAACDPSAPTSYADANGHGTGVAGAMAAADNAGSIVGVAPGVPIYSVRVLDAKEKGTVSTLLCGLNWVLSNHTALGIAVANLSLGFPGTDDGNCGRTNADLVHQAICELTAAGVTVVAAAGNQTSDLATITPAAYDEVLTATNMADYDGRPGRLGRGPAECTSAASIPDDQYSSSSNFAVSAADAAHTIAAPGVCPYTTKKGNQAGYIQSGTSMSAATTSGVVLDCLSTGGACVGMSPAQVITTVRASAQAGAADRGHTFTGDPLSPVAGRYYGFLATTVPGTTDIPTTTPPASTTETPTPTTTPPTTTPPPDVTAPTVQIVDPTAGSVVSGIVVLRATAADDTGVTMVKYYVGTTLLGSGTLVNGMWELSYNSRLVANGTYSVVARATDAAGNVGTSPAVTLTVRN